MTELQLTAKDRLRQPRDYNQLALIVMLAAILLALINIGFALTRMADVLERATVVISTAKTVKIQQQHIVEPVAPVQQQPQHVPTADEA